MPSVDSWSLNAIEGEGDDGDDDDAEGTGAYSMSQSASIARAAAAASERIRTPRVPGAEYRSARAEGDMRKPGRPDPFAYAPLGAGLPNPKQRKHRRGGKVDGGVATPAERRALLRSLGAGKRKRKQGEKKGNKKRAVGGSALKTMTKRSRQKTVVNRRRK